MTTVSRDLIEALKKQRVGVTSSIIAAIALVGVVHAPVAPVAAGCFIALAYLILRSRSRLSSGRTGR